MKIVAFLPVKGTSERIHNKNLRIFNGEPLFVFTLKKLLRCSFIDSVYLDSENEEILEIGNRLGAELLRRDPSLANNKTDGHQLFHNEVSKVDADIYIQHLCTSPFIKEETIKNAIEILKKNTEFDSVVLGKKEKCYFWSEGKPLYDINKIPNSIDLPLVITEAMSLYVMRGKVARETGRRIGRSPKMIFADPIELIDINVEEDLKLAEKVGLGFISEEEKRLNVIGRFLSSSILSDVCDNLKLNCVLSSEYKSNINGAKLLGRARTLHIRKATSEDSDNSIYEALKSYKHVVNNDIIVVRNDLGKLAYFGELNMSMAIRSGAKGAIISGVTRDTRETAEAGFPVFAKGSYCKDIKGHGAVESMNKPIEIDSVVIEPSDLIFADQDGIVVIPRKYEIQVLGGAISIMAAEKKIVEDVCQDVDLDSLVIKHGFF